MNPNELAEFLDAKIDEGDVRETLFADLEQSFAKMIITENSPLRVIYDGLRIFNKGPEEIDGKPRRIFSQLEQWPELIPHLNFFASTCLFFEQRFEEGINFLNNWIGSKVQRKDLAFEALGFYQEKLEKYDEAIKSFDTAIVRNSHREPLCSWGKANVASAQKKFELAEQYLLNSRGENEICYSRFVSTLNSHYILVNELEKGLEFLTRESQMGFEGKKRYILLLRQAEILSHLHRYSDSQILFVETYQLADTSDEKVAVLKLWVSMLIDSGEIKDGLDIVEGAFRLELSKENRKSLHLCKSELHEELGQLVDALAECEKALNLSPTNARRSALSKKIRLESQLKRWGNCNTTWDSLFAISKSEDEKCDCFFEKGLWLEKKGEFADSLSFYRKALGTSDEDEKGHTYNRICRVELALNKPEKAFQTMEECLALPLNNRARSIALYNISDVYLSLKNIPKAIISLNNSLELNSSVIHRIKCYFSLCGILRGEGRHDEAFELIEKVLSLTEDKYFISNAILTKGKILKNQGKFDDAIKCLEKIQGANESPTYNAIVDLEISEIYTEIDKTENALAILLQAVNKDNVESSVKSGIHFHLGEIYNHVSKYELALEEFKKFLEIEKKNFAPCIILLCMAYLKTEKSDEGIEYLELLKEKAHSDSQWLLEMGQGLLFHTMSNYVESNKHFKNANVTQSNRYYSFIQMRIAENYFRQDLYQQALDAAREVEPIIRSSGKNRIEKQDKFCELMSQIHSKLGSPELSKNYLEEAIGYGSEMAYRIFSIDEKVSQLLLENRKIAESEDSSSQGNDYDSKSRVLRRPPIRDRSPESESSSLLISENTELREAFNNSSELACHYTSSETALFNILPSRYNHDQVNSHSMVSFRLNPLGLVNDIEEGELRLRISTNTNKELEQNLFARLKAQLRSELKVYCLTWSNISFDKITYSNAPFLIPPMWSRYSFRHSGVCIIFDLVKLKKYFREHCERQSNRLFKMQRVIYAYPQLQKKISQMIDYHQLVAFGSDSSIRNFLCKNLEMDDSRFNVFFFKPPQWNYEKEFRMILHNENPGPYYAYLPPDCIKSVVMGAEVKLGFRSLFKEVAERNKWSLFEYSTTTDTTLGMLKRVDLSSTKINLETG